MNFTISGNGKSKKQKTKPTLKLKPYVFVIGCEKNWISHQRSKFEKCMVGHLSSYEFWFTFPINLSPKT
jgi:hypothetical protein